MKQISRREFLKLMGLYLGGLVWSPGWPKYQPVSSAWPQIRLETLPREIARIIGRAPKTKFNEAGYLQLLGDDGDQEGRVPFAQTIWNREKRATIDKLYTSQPWGIVLHWFGDRARHNLSLPGYLAGFNGEQLIDEISTRTSAHFLVGDDAVVNADTHNNISVGIIQTQSPAADGVPYVSSHLLEEPFDKQSRDDNYFVKALEELSFQRPEINSILPALFLNQNIDPNLVTLSIEITGFDFDNLDYLPTTTKISNVVSLVIAIMKRYNISATNILGHMEFNLEKADPGKNFLAMIRYLVGIKALVDDDDEVKALVFGQFVGEGQDLHEGVISYFRYIRDYLLLISSPDKVYVWESVSKYWQVWDLITGYVGGPTLTAGSFSLPFRGDLALDGRFIDPSNHEGVDILFPDSSEGDGVTSTQPVKLMANGECIYLGEARNAHWAKTAMFLHRQVDSAQIVSIYAHLSAFGNVSVGDNLRRGELIGVIDKTNGLLPGYLHFSIAYGGTWDTDLTERPYVPPNVGPTWIRQRFLDPIEFLRTMNRRYVPRNDLPRLEEILAN